MPSPRLDDSELAKVMVDSAIPSRSQIIRDGITACGLTNKVPAVSMDTPDLPTVVAQVRSRSMTEGER
jgi:hypothetical protein